MAESNATQVILTDDGIRIINAQNTADNAASGVANLNDPNLMSVIEKQTQAAQYAGLTSQYNVILARAKDASISTTALTTAYTNLSAFMTAILTDTTKASDVNRDTYKSLTGAYNTALSNVQNALNDSFNTDIDNMQSSVSVASQAASSASIVASQATSTGNNASQVASQAASAANQASADYTALSAGVEDGSVVHITTKTVIDAAVIGTAEIADAAITDAKMGNISANHIITGSIDASKVTVAKLDAGNITTGTLSTDRLNVGKLSALSANLGDVTTGSLKGVDIVANTFSTPNGSFTTDANGNVVASNLTIRGVTNLVYNASLLGGSGTNIPGWGISNNGYYSSYTLHDGVPSIGFNASTGSGVWNIFAQSKLYPLNGLTGQPYSASVWFVDDGSEAAMKYQFTLAFFDANGNRLASGYAGNTWNGNPTSQGWAYKTINNIISPSTAVYVAIQYWAYNGTGHALFSSPMLTQTAQSTGYQPDTGNVVSAGEIDGSVINGSTINGTTFNAGDIISSTYNTSRFYPTTITPAGLVATTGFNSMDGLRTEMSAGSFVTKYRAVHSNSNQYEAYDGVFSGDELALNSGFTNGIDMGFQQSVSGNQLTGQVVLSPLNGIHLWGSTQSIHFSGLQMNGTGITMNSYGNILADQGSTWWRVVDFSGKEIANFGTDVAGSNAIKFNRELDIGNFHINTGHTFTSWDKGAIHFAKGGGGAADIYAGAVNYTSLVKSSLLSVKLDVQKADTAYWAQLVNSIDLATYQYKSDDNTSHLRLSSIVDDVNVTKQWQLPDVFISRDENGKLSGVDDSVLLNATLATVQEQQKQIDQLNGHNMELEARLNKLEAKLNG
ncbi:phage tail protein [Lactiplantibacillus plantarum]|uniref:phage tail protein n=1 Tax=Lactiplantibacillus plantarum TaxID=1590 RepID=UPI00217E26FC|nr:phage tail protein [Lactiplantibacillus plantarum]UWF32613.1 phage tail protein [Lactiplantibacillus plantarum]UWF37947.1 phage tail protein [Lactiplantibacillus plantarum]UWF40945.1 phage tail protein [Lactiplantibacillus plantarum]WPB50973.1 phage tail protein [Lactiplantibacillus plantarum]